jgi:uncharacterized membrane protein
VKGRHPVVAVTLVAGVAISFVLLVIGVIEAMIDPLPLIQRSPGVGEALRGMLRGDAAATMTAGLLVLMLTPFARVVVLIFDFARKREGPFVIISVVVLLLLFTSIAISVR